MSTPPLAFMASGGPTLGSIAGELYRSLLPIAWDDQNQEWALAAYLAGHGIMAQPIDDLAADTDAGPGWSPIMSVDRAPLNALPWLGQWVGVTVDTSRTEAEQRQQIRDEAGFHRGTPAAIVAVAQATLTDTRTVLMTERDTSAYRLKVRTYDIETPDPAVTLAALLTQKPAGIVLDYATVSTWTWQTLRDKFATWQAVKDHYATWQGVRDNVPPAP